VRCLVNRSADAEAVPPPSGDAAAFHACLPGYRPTPLRNLPEVAAELGVAAVALKDESDRLGLPSFKVLGAAWAVERSLRRRPHVDTLVAASAGNHGRAVARVAALRGLRCRVFLPVRSAAARREAIAAEGAEVVVVDGDYEDATARARVAGAERAALEIADVGDSGPASWVIDGYATLFAEAAEQGDHDLILVPVGVGSLAAAAARFAARAGAKAIGIEPVTAACLTASLRSGRPTRVPTRGTTMAGLDCAEVSAAAWPTLRDGIHGTVTVHDADAHAAMRELAEAGLAIGESGAAPLAGLRPLVADPGCSALRDAIAIGPDSRVLLIATEGPTDPVAYRRAVGELRGPAATATPQPRGSAF
jgi:diaminopropionate ammonia-lyase